jgi:hypothetical protein
MNLDANPDSAHRTDTLGRKITAPKRSSIATANGTYTRMSGNAAWLIALIATSTIWMVVHVFILVRVLRAPQLRRSLRALALVPVATPFVSWLSGARVVPLLWIALLILYATLYGSS